MLSKRSNCLSSAKTNEKITPNQEIHFLNLFEKNLNKNYYKETKTLSSFFGIIMIMIIMRAKKTFTIPPPDVLCTSSGLTYPDTTAIIRVCFIRRQNQAAFSFTSSFTLSCDRNYLVVLQQVVDCIDHIRVKFFLVLSRNVLLLVLRRVALDVGIEE